MFTKYYQAYKHFQAYRRAITRHKRNSIRVTSKSTRQFWQETKTIKMAVLHRDIANNELFITPIRGLYDEYSMSVEEFKDKNAQIMKNRWVDTTHGDNGEKIYELFNPGEAGDIIKENLQEWLCDNRFEITSSISIALRNHERSYADWFRYIEEMSGPDELALYSLSRKYGVHTSVFNKSYIWTTLMNHVNIPDEEIIAKSGVNLVFLGPCKYGIVKNIRTPQAQPPKPSATSGKCTRTRGKITVRDSTGGKSSRGTGRGTAKRPTSSRTLSSTRQQNYGITPSQPSRVSKRTKPQIDYLALNDGLEEDTPASPKRRRRSSDRPKSEPSTRRLWAQQQMGSPKASSTLSGVPATTENVTSNTTDVAQHSETLEGVPPTSESGNLTLTGVPTNNTLPDLVLNRTDNGDQEFNAAQALIALGDSLESTVDDIDENAMLMPIGGRGVLPLDVAPQPLQLDQVNVDAAIAEMVQTEEHELMPRTDVTNNEPEYDKNDATKDDKGEPAPEDEDDVPLATLAKTLDDPKAKVKGVLKTKLYGLKKKPTSNRSFKCPLCETWKSTTHRLNEHFKRRHPPMQCGICGRSFDIPSSLSRHMYDHDVRRYNCNKCEQSFHFESELKSHWVSHRSKSKPSFQCMKSKCGRWFMRKWDLTQHLQSHSGKKFKCEYKNCSFSTETDKQLKEHYKSHSDDCTVKCKSCGKGFKYRSGLKRHRDAGC